MSRPMLAAAWEAGVERILSALHGQSPPPLGSGPAPRRSQPAHPTPALYRAFCVAFAGLSAATLFAGRIPLGSRGAAYLAIHLLASGAMFGAWWLAGRAGPSATAWALAAGAAARLAVAFAPQLTSHDVGRYLWDARVALAGFDPYRLDPSASVLAALRAAAPPPPEHPLIATLYPPGALALFVVAAAAGRAAPWVWRCLVALASLGTLGLVARAARGKPAERHFALVALSPLLVLEAGVGGHVDAFAALAVALALAASSAGRAALALGLGATVKLVPGAAVLALAARARRWSPILVFAAVVLAVYAAFIAAGLRPVGSIAPFLARWRFGSPVYAAISALAGQAAAQGFALVLALCALAWAAVLARGDAMHRAMLLAIAAPFLAGPVVHPWYLMPLVPLLAFAPEPAVLAWVTALPLTHEVIDLFDVSGEWRPAAWPLWMVAGAVGVGAIVGWRRTPPASR